MRERRGILMATAKSANCLNCKTEMTGSFCSLCGQRDIGERLSSNLLFSMFFEALTEFDSRFWRTLRKLAVNPGAVALSYIQGSRANFINPIRFFFATFTIYIALSALTGAMASIANRAVILTNENSASERALFFAGEVRNTLSSQVDLIVFLVIPFFALLVRWQYWRAKRNYAETLCFISYVFGMGYLLTIPILLIQYGLQEFSTAPKNIIIFILMVIGARSFFEMNWLKSLIGTAISAAGYGFLSFASTSAITIARLWWLEL